MQSNAIKNIQIEDPKHYAILESLHYTHGESVPLLQWFYPQIIKNQYKFTIPMYYWFKKQILKQINAMKESQTEHIDPPTLNNTELNDLKQEIINLKKENNIYKDNVQDPIIKKLQNTLSSSIKNNASPVNRIAIVAQSTIVDLSPRNIYPKRAT